MPDYVVFVLVAMLALVFIASTLARRYPHIHWLQLFRVQRPYDPARDRDLDTAWMDPAARFKAERDKPRDLVTAAREEFRAFAAELPQLPPERKAKLRRSSNVHAGIQLILLGIALPFGYHLLSMMTFFSEVSRTENILVMTGAGVCIVLGVVAIWRSGKD